MILGIGADISHIEGIRRSVRRFGDLWVDHLFTIDEKKLCLNHIDPVVYLSKAFCGKEACAKAIGTGLAEGVEWRDIEILQASQVSVRISGDAKSRIQSKAPDGFNFNITLGLSCDHLFAQSFVILSAP